MATQKSDNSPTKPSFKDRFKGEVKILTGRVKGDEEMIHHGMRLKDGGKSSALDADPQV